MYFSYHFRKVVICKSGHLSAHHHSISYSDVSVFDGGGGGDDDDDDNFALHCHFSHIRNFIKTTVA
jgi:hypothetical protein